MLCAKVMLFQLKGLEYPGRSWASKGTLDTEWVLYIPALE